MTIENPDSTLADFNKEAKEVFNAFKDNDTIVKSATVSYNTVIRKFSLKNDNINNDQLYEDVIEKALD